MRTITPDGAIPIPKNATCVFKGEIYDTYQWQQEMYDGSFATFEMLKRCDSVQVLVVHENKLLVQKQEQPNHPPFRSFPGGRHDHDSETEQEAAARELLEETGYVCAEWKLLSVKQPHGKIDHFIYTFLAYGVSGPQELQLDAGEKIENVWMNIDEVKTLINQDDFRFSEEKLFAHAKNADDLKELPSYKI